jgi:hypothetical protein
MAAIISNPPRGLYSLLGLRDMGDVPRLVADQCATVTDITQFLLLNRETIFSTPIATGGAPGWRGVGTLRVPAGELWYIHELGLESGVLGAGVAGRVCLGYAENDGAPVAVSEAQAAAAGEAIAIGRTIDPFWAVPGATFPFFVKANTGGSFNCTLTLLFTRLRI